MKSLKFCMVGNFTCKLLEAPLSPVAYDIALDLDD